jgi:hypothetical protein
LRYRPCQDRRENIRQRINDDDSHSSRRHRSVVERRIVALIGINGAICHGILGPSSMEVSLGKIIRPTMTTHKGQRGVYLAQDQSQGFNVEAVNDVQPVQHTVFLLWE